MEWALGSEEEGKKRKQQGQDCWAEREHLEKKISPRVNRNLRLLWTILASLQSLPLAVSISQTS
jgi:hypothetical protein